MGEGGSIGSCGDASGGALACRCVVFYLWVLPSWARTQLSFSIYARQKLLHFLNKRVYEMMEGYASYR